jgi:hypothetical protein
VAFSFEEPNAVQGFDLPKAMGWTPPPSTGIKRAKVEVSAIHLTRMGASAMNITTVGIDLAKNVMQVHGDND